MNRSKATGTAGESGVVKVCRLAGFPHAERRALAGSADVGDVLLAPGLIAEVKAGAAAKQASLGLIDMWLAETERERVNARADVALLVVQRRGFAPARAGSWDCWMRLQDIVWLTDGTARVEPIVGSAAVCLRLDHALLLARLGGYGDPLPIPRPAGLTIRQPPPVPEVRVLDDLRIRCVCGDSTLPGLTHGTETCRPRPEATA